MLKTQIIVKIHLNRYNEQSLAYIKGDIIVSEKTAPLLVNFIKNSNFAIIKNIIEKYLKKDDKEKLLANFETIFLENFQTFKEGIVFETKFKNALDNFVDAIVEYIEENQKEYEYDFTEAIIDEKNKKIYTLFNIL